MSDIIKIGLTHGDLNGIGYEVILKTLSDERCLELFTPILYGSEQALNYYKKGLKNLSYTPEVQVISDASKAHNGALNLVEVNTDGGDVQVQFGATSALAGKLAIQALTMARNDLVSGDISAVVTAPINKSVVQGIGFPFVGHTQFFAAPFREMHQPLMLFAKGDIRVALVSIHESIKRVAESITREHLDATIRQLHSTLQQDFGIIQPRIAVMGLNPHAGEGGLLGKEEAEIISPAVQSAWDDGLHVFGPFAADGFWGSGAYESFDAVLAMYHDQGLLPFKLLAMEEGVNITAGLPIIRTSPDHGTAFDIAGKGVANESSFRNAIYTAIDIHRHRERYKQATANPLPKLYVERGKDNVQLDLSRSEDELEA